MKKTRKNSLSLKHTHHRDHGPARVDSDTAGLDATDESRGLDLEKVSEKRGGGRRKVSFFFDADRRPSIDFVGGFSSHCFAPDARREGEPGSLILLTLNIALKSTAPRRVRPEPEEAPWLSATTIVSGVVCEEEMKWFFFPPPFVCTRKNTLRSLFFSISILSLSLFSIPQSNGRESRLPNLPLYSTTSHRRRGAPRSHTCSPSPPQTLRPRHRHRLRRQRSQTAPCHASTRALPR